MARHTNPFIFHGLQIWIGCILNLWIHSYVGSATEFSTNWQCLGFNFPHHQRELQKVMFALNRVNQLSKAVASSSISATFRSKFPVFCCSSNMLCLAALEQTCRCWSVALGWWPRSRALLESGWQHAMMVAVSTFDSLAKQAVEQLMEQRTMELDFRS